MTFSGAKKGTRALRPKKSGYRAWGVGHTINNNCERQRDFQVRQRTDIRIIHPTTKPTGLYLNPAMQGPPPQHTQKGICTQQPTTATPQVATDSLASKTIIPLLRDNKHTQPTNEVKRQTTTAVRFLQTTQSPSGFQSPNPPQHENVFNGALDGD